MWAQNRLATAEFRPHKPHVTCYLLHWNAQHHQSPRLLKLCKDKLESSIVFTGIICLVHLPAQNEI